MLTNERILEDIKAAMELNRNSKAICNDALTHAMTLIMNNEKELQNRINEEYKRGMNDAIELYGKEKVQVGDIVKNKLDNIKATILDIEDFENRMWTVYTENACVEIWHETDFVRTGECVDPCAVLFK